MYRGVCACPVKEPGHTKGESWALLDPGRAWSEGGTPTLGRGAGEQIPGGGPGPLRRTSELSVPIAGHARIPLLWAWPLAFTLKAAAGSGRAVGVRGIYGLCPLCPPAPVGDAEHPCPPREAREMEHWLCLGSACPEPSPLTMTREHPWVTGVGRCPLDLWARFRSGTHPGPAHQPQAELRL